MSEIPWGIIIPNVGWIAVFIAILIASLNFNSKFIGWQKDVDHNFGKIEKPLNALVLIHRKELVDNYSEVFGIKLNPHPDKEFLLQKLRDGTITREEGFRLRAILEEEQREKKGGVVGLLIIAGLLFLLAIILGDSD